MSRIKRGVAKHARHKKVLKLAKGYRASYSKLYRVAKQQSLRSGAFAFAHRRKKKGDFRKLWITRINAAARMNDISYSRLMNGLHKGNVSVNRKILAELAVSDPAAFTGYVEIAKANLK
ncbi:MAG TPA: 50S ribosomal protein L20 [Clostridiales bacterium]|nr:50S ribosomal protein L20 [Clostridiales bacterium]